jgi:hypothetical protein
MARFLSPDWVDEFNAAVATVDVADADLSASLVASEGTFSVAQVVTGAPSEVAGPGGSVRTVLVVADGGATLTLAAEERNAPPNVTISLPYPEAVALSRGELDPAEALARGVVSVRGDLAVLVAGQTLLAAAAGRLGDLAAATTY